MSEKRTRQAEVEGNTSAELRRAVNYGRGWVRAALSETANKVSIYVNDPEATLADHISQRRASLPVNGGCILDAQVTEHFVDPEKFGPLNIWLEAIQNAEPNDSEGTRFLVEFFAEGQWIPLVDPQSGKIHLADFSNNQIKRVRIRDNGKGYIPQDAVLIGGNKRGQASKAGKFGTGMKAGDRMTLNHCKMMRGARNWLITPFLREQVTSMGLKKTVSYEVDFYDEILPGSVVEFWALSDEMIDGLRQVPDAYLPCDPTFKSRMICETEAGLILEKATGKPEVTVKGRKYHSDPALDMPLLFSYDLHKTDIDDQNRYSVGKAAVMENIRDIWAHSTDVKMFERLITAFRDDKNLAETQMEAFDPPPQFWQAFRKVFDLPNERLAYISDGREYDEKDAPVLKQDFRLLEVGYKCVYFDKNPFMAAVLEKHGIYNLIGVLYGTDKTDKKAKNHISNAYVGWVDKEDGVNSFAFALGHAAVVMDHLTGGDYTIRLFTDDSREWNYEEYKASGSKDSIKVCKVILQANAPVREMMADIDHIDPELSDFFAVDGKQNYFKVRQGKQELSHHSLSTWNFIADQPLQMTLDLRNFAMVKDGFQKEINTALQEGVHASPFILALQQKLHRAKTAAAKLMRSKMTWAVLGLAVFGGVVADKNGYIQNEWSHGEGFDALHVSDVNISVSIGESLNQEALKRRNRTFLSYPPLDEGNFMREALLGKYDGKNWSVDINTPDFENPHFNTNTRIHHLQKLGRFQWKTTLRTMVGGYIDTTSIKAIGKDKNILPIKQDDIKVLQNGEVFVSAPYGTVSVAYDTLKPNPTSADVMRLTQDDYRKLDSATYAYYTDTLAVDPKTIQFSPDFIDSNPSAELAHITTLADYIAFTEKLDPVSRVTLNYRVARGMRYIHGRENKSTVQAYEDFRAGRLPEQDLLSFVFNSRRLERPGDGDCDVHNSIFIMLNRLSGIPSRISYIITKDGGQHVSSEVFFPNIGWMDYDATGTSPESAETSNSRRPKTVLEQMVDKQQYMELGCYDLLKRDTPVKTSDAK